MDNYSDGLLNMVAQHDTIQCHKALFGLITRYIYTPTQSKLTSFNLTYGPQSRNELLQLLRADDAALCKQAAKGTRLEQKTNGNLLIEGYRSVDGQFAAVRLLQWAELDYRPATEVRFLTGDAAQALGKILL